ncbi:MAG TPA: FAD-dependent oxidoreductase [Caulobacter sp.]|nr:FAD-dependent oxidoreductase [Caulobacter sp.]
MTLSSLPVVIIGAGPVGLAAAAHLLARGIEPLILEADESIAGNVRRWSHVRVFSPWKYNIDAAAKSLLQASDWQAPDDDHFPTGAELIAGYLEPLANTPAIASALRLGARVRTISRERRDRMKDEARGETPFVVRYEQHGQEHDLLARAVIDASGTFGTPNPIGAAGVPAIGERGAQDQIWYGIPDVLDADRNRYAGKRVLVIGSGHSAFNVLVDLAQLHDETASTPIHWAIRKGSLASVAGGGENDQLRERGALGQKVADLVAAGRIVLHTGFHLDRLAQTPDGLTAWHGDLALPPVDEIVGATGFRPDLHMLDELRLSLDAGTQSPLALGPLIDPNLHSCGTVRPHGAFELSHPEPGFYIVGMKSYGRAPTFLMLTGYEQVRSVAAAIDGDHEAARRVELALPETGVCNTAPRGGASAACSPSDHPAASTQGGCGPKVSSCCR